MNTQANPFAYLHNRERTAGHKPALPQIMYSGRLTFRDEVLAAFSAGPNTIKQVAATMGQDVERVRHACKKLVAQGKIVRAGKAGADMIWKAKA